MEAALLGPGWRRDEESLESNEASRDYQRRGQRRPLDTVMDDPWRMCSVCVLSLCQSVGEDLVGSIVPNESLLKAQVARPYP